MKVRFNSSSSNLLLNKEQTFRSNAGWDENFQTYEDEVLESLINPVENYETNRYIHKPYTSSNGIEQTDIWFHFYFVNDSGNYVLDYKSVGISQTDKLLSDLKNSFFRLEFYKTPNNEPPNRSNRRLVFAKNLATPIGERISVTGKFEKFYVPVFVGSSLRNKENMYLFWFHDDTVLEETLLTGTTFFMTAKFYNGVDGSKIQFANKEIPNGSDLVEEDDLYFLVEMNRDDAPTYHYEIRDYDSTGNVRGNRRGESLDPIKFYEIGGTVGSGTTSNTPTPSPSSTTLTPTPTVTLTPTPTPTSTVTTGANWSNGTSAMVSTSLPGDNPSTGTTTGTLTVVGGPVQVYVSSYKAFNYANISYALLEISGLGQTAVTNPSGGSTTVYSSVLTVPVGTYTYTLSSVLTIDGGLTSGMAYANILIQ